MRRDAIYPSIIVGVPPQEDVWLGKATERLFLPAIRMTMPEVVDYDLPVHGAFHNLAIVSIRKAFPGHARKVMHAIWGTGLLSLTKGIVVVDDWVDVHDYGQVMWQAGANVDPARDVVLADGPLDHLDHAPSRQLVGGKIGIAATYVEDPANPNTSAGLAWVHYTGKSNHDWLASDAMFIVFSNRCMHLGCPVLASSTGFGCPCHGGQYDTRGVRVAGPPIRPLDRFQWEVKDGNLVITNRWSVDYLNGQIHYFPVKMPGQPVDLPGLPG